MSKEKAVDSRVDITNLPDGYERVVQGSTMPGESVFQYSQTPGEKVFKNGDAYIVLGKDNQAAVEQVTLVKQTQQLLTWLWVGLETLVKNI